MSLKYQRIKKQDEALWPPIKWVLRAFSSITMAVILLTTVCIYGTLTSVPLGQLALIPEVSVKGLTYFALFATPFVPLILLGRLVTRGQSIERTLPLWLVLTAAGGVAGFFLARQGTWGLRPEALVSGDADTAVVAAGWLLSLVAMFGLLVALVAPAAATGWRIGKRWSHDAQFFWSAGWTLAAAAVAVPLIYVAWIGTAQFDIPVLTQAHHDYAATTLYRLRAFEMTELEFYSWWPFQVILGLFVANLIVATIRRIEFKFVNIGVLTVHSGIITIAIGSMIYGSVKKEGDIVLFKPRFGGEAVSYFYDRNKPAIYFTHDGRELRIPLEDLPRYNDYDPDKNELDIRLHEVPEFQEMFGPDLKATIPGFYAYAQLRDEWRDAGSSGRGPENPALTYRLRFGDDGRDFTLFANDPEERVLRVPSLDLAFFTDVDDDWLEALLTPTEGRHAVIVEVPDEDFRQVYTIEEGQRISVGETGYELTVEQLMDRYPFPVMTEGYEGAEPSAAVVMIQPPDGAAYQRWAIDPYPQLTQDFLPGGEGGRPQRVAPNPEINVTYIDSSRIKLTAVRPEGAGPDELSLIYRLPGGLVNVEPLEIGEGVTLGGAVEITVADYMQSAEKYHVPEPVPQSERRPSEEGVYQHAALPVEISYDANGHTYHHREWLGHLRYVEYPTEHIRPERFNVPEIGEIEVAFGRVREPLPFQMELLSFEMIPYAGTGQTDNPIPQDYVSQLKVSYPDGTSYQAETRMNNPLIVRAVPFSNVLNGEASLREYLSLGKIKVSQAEWDPQNQAFTGLGIGNNAAIRLIALGAVMMSLGIPWAFYVKPAILRARKRRLQLEHAERAAAAARAEREAGRTQPAPAAGGNGHSPARKPQPVSHATDREHDSTSV